MGGGWRIAAQSRAIGGGIASKGTGSDKGARRIEESRSSFDLCPEMPSATLRSVALRCVALATSLLHVESREPAFVHQ